MIHSGGAMIGSLMAQAGSEEAAEASSRLADLKVWLTNCGIWLTEPDTRLLIAAIMGTWGLWLLMPGRRQAMARVWGGIVAGMAAACLLSLAPTSPVSLGSAMFAVLASLTVVAAVGTVSSRSPIYCAVWFAVTLLGVGGLFLVNGAQFLGIATVAVYAGAIVVTFLFVLMLAQPQGRTYYDRISWGPTAQLFGCAAGAVMTCLLIWGLSSVPTPVSADAENPVLAADHVANFGGTLFSTHLIGVQMAAVLLFVALVGAVAIAATAGQRSGIQQQVDQLLSAGTNNGAGEIRHE